MSPSRVSGPGITMASERFVGTDLKLPFGFAVISASA
jgi:hypothetical protein